MAAAASAAPALSACAAAALSARVTPALSARATAFSLSPFYMVTFPEGALRDPQRPRVSVHRRVVRHVLVNLLLPMYCLVLVFCAPQKGRYLSVVLVDIRYKISGCALGIIAFFDFFRFSPGGEIC